MLVVDMGNTRIKWSMVHGQVLNVVYAVRHGGDIKALLDHPSWCQMPRPERIVVSNVLGASFAAGLSAWVADCWGSEIEYVSAAERGFDILHCYQDINRLGVDRWVSMVAVHARWPGASCICDCGTALTIDFLTAEGRHQGGLILPGLEMMRKALSEDARAIDIGPDHDEEPALSLYARNTSNAVMKGTLYALVAAISRIVADARTQTAEPLNVIITGGDTARLLPLLGDDFEHQPNLVLQGLALIAAANK